MCRKCAKVCRKTTVEQMDTLIERDAVNINMKEEGILSRANFVQFN